MHVIKTEENFTSLLQGSLKGNIEVKINNDIYRIVYGIVYGINISNCSKKCHKANVLIVIESKIDNVHSTKIDREYQTFR